MAGAVDIETDMDIPTLKDLILSHITLLYPPSTAIPLVTRTSAYYTIVLVPAHSSDWPTTYTAMVVNVDANRIVMASAPHRKPIVAYKELYDFTGDLIRYPGPEQPLYPTRHLDNRIGIFWEEDGLKIKTEDQKQAPWDPDRNRRAQDRPSPRPAYEFATRTEAAEP